MIQLIQALNSHLTTFAASRGIPPAHVDTGNKTLPSSLSPQLRASLKEEAVTASCGLDALTRHTGVYLVETVVTAGTGPDEVYPLADALIQYFARGSNCGLPGLVLKQAFAGQLTIKDGLCIVPVNIPYYAYLED